MSPSRPAQPSATPTGSGSDKSFRKYLFRRSPVGCSRRPHGQAASVPTRGRQMPSRACLLRLAPAAKSMPACADRARSLPWLRWGESSACPFITIDDRLCSRTGAWNSGDRGLCSADPARWRAGGSEPRRGTFVGSAGEAQTLRRDSNTSLPDFGHRTLTPGLSQTYTRITPRLIGNVVTQNPQRRPRTCVFPTRTAA